MCKGSVIIICPLKSDKYSFMGYENKDTYLLIVYIPTQASQSNFSLPDQQRTYSFVRNMHQMDYQSLHPLSLSQPVTGLDVMTLISPTKVSRSSATRCAKHFLPNNLQRRGGGGAIAPWHEPEKYAYFLYPYRGYELI